MKPVHLLTPKHIADRLNLGDWSLNGDIAPGVTEVSSYLTPSSGRMNRGWKLAIQVTDITTGTVQRTKTEFRSSRKPKTP